MRYMDTEKKTFKTMFLSTTAWVVWLAILLTATMMALQQVLGSTDLLPHETMAWGLTFIAGAYTGMDRIAQAVKSRTLDYGDVDLGDPRKLRWVIVCLFLLITEALILQTFQHVKGLALETLIIAFSTAGGAYVIGNKAISASAFTTSTGAKRTSGTEGGNNGSDTTGNPS